MMMPKLAAVVLVWLWSRCCAQWIPPYSLQCAIELGEYDGTTDEGTIDHPCESCSLACNQDNKQKSVYTSWDFEPSLRDANLFDVETKVEWTHFSRLREYGKNGIYQAMRFVMAKKTDEAKAFGGYMGPQIKGNGPHVQLAGMHLFSVWDTHKPNEDGSSPAGRRLAVPAADPGHCKRNCQDCGLHPELSAAGLTTGTQCKLEGVTVDDGDAYVYRIRMSSPSASSQYDGRTYFGTEWEVIVTDLASDEVFVLGRILFEGDTEAQGIAQWKNFHEHLGCTPCDAFYESTLITGPFILQPSGVHKILRSSVEPPADQYTCRLFRTVALSGLSVRIETGPGVSPASWADTQHASLYSSCVEASPAPSPAPLPSPAPTPTPAPTSKTCKKKHCKNSLKDWSKKCSWKKCRGCQECESSWQCKKKLCKKNAKDWSEKCTWESCAGCKQCGRDRRMHETSDDVGTYVSDVIVV